MKLQINSTHKIIKLEEQVNLGELFTFLEEILPDLKWREYSIEGSVIVYDYGQNPIIVNPITSPTFPVNPIYPTAPNYPWITYCISSTGEIK